MSSATTRLARLAATWTSNIDKHSTVGEPAVRLCNYTDVYKNASITNDLDFMNATATTEQIERFRLRVDDVIITKDSETADDIGIPAFVEYEADDLICGYHLAMVRADPDRAHPRFLYWAMSSRFVREQWEVLATGVTRVGLRSADIARVKIPTHSVIEQRAIAEYLDRETARIDVLIAKQEQFVATLGERRAASISLRVPTEHVALVQLRQLSAAPIESGYDESANRENPREWPRYVRTTDVASLTSLRSDVRVTISPEAAATATVQRNDLLLTRAGSVGVSYLHESDESAAYAGYLVRVRPRSTVVVPRYLAYWTQSQSFSTQIAHSVVRSTIENFSASKYRAMRVPLPPLEEQHRIVADLDEQTAKVDALIEKAEHFIVLAKERRAALITAAVTGQIAVPGFDPDETTKVA